MAQTNATKEVCLSCKREATPNIFGTWYDAKGGNGMLLRFWMCNKCAIPLGPKQGPVDMAGVGQQGGTGRK